jgi:hypothetical protein
VGHLEIRVFILEIIADGRIVWRPGIGSPSSENSVILTTRIAIISREVTFTGDLIYEAPGNSVKKSINV